MKKDKEDMEDIKKREVTNIELIWDNQEDLFELAESSKFTNFVLEESLKAIISALENNEEKAELFNVFNMSIILEIKKEHFKTVLDKINSLFILNEEYERCNQLKKLISKHKL